MVNRTPQKANNEYSLSEHTLQATASPKTAATLNNTATPTPTTTATSSSLSSASASSLDANQQQLQQQQSQQKKTGNLNSLASVAQVLLKHDKSSYSLSNLSAAASHEFMLNYGAAPNLNTQVHAHSQQQLHHQPNLGNENRLIQNLKRL